MTILKTRALGAAVASAAFIVPGANPASACLDVARSVIRRAERRAVEIRDSGAEVNDAVLRYMTVAAECARAALANLGAKP